MSEPTTIGDAIAADAELGMRGPTPPVLGPARWRCAGTEPVCEVVVAKRGDYCEACAARYSAQLRATYVAKARATLPAWRWARFGPELIDAITKGKPKAERDRAERLLHVAFCWRREHGSLVLLGDTGAGKTVAAVALLHRILDRAADRPLPVEDMAFASGARFVEARQLAEARREHPLGKGEPPAVRHAIAATLLVLDELGYEPQQDAAVPDVLDRRYKLERPTIITSGLTEAGLAKRYGDATRRRMTELGRVVSVHA